MKLKSFAYAKINLGLRILRKRPDGFHDIDTVFQRVSWADAITFESADQHDFSCSDPFLMEDPEANLVVRAVRAVEEAVGGKLPLRIHLDKRLPFGAGLGGGSSDCAATLLACRDEAVRLHGVRLPDELLESIARRLGSDVPFFLRSGAQRGTGTGTTLDRVLRTDGEPWQLALPVVLVVPDIHISSGTAYRGVDPRSYEEYELPSHAIVVTDDMARYRTSLVNDFEPSVFAAFPQIERIKLMLLDHGARYASLSGSGSAVFGIFGSADTASECAEEMRRGNPQSWRTWVGMPA